MDDNGLPATWEDPVARLLVSSSDSEKEEGAITQILLSAALGDTLIAREATAAGRGGSVPGRAANVNRNFDASAARIRHDNFGGNGTPPLYSKQDFATRFRMLRVVLERVMSRVVGQGVFVRRLDALSRPGIHPLQRIVAALRMLAYGVCADAVDKYARVSATAGMQSLRHFCADVVRLFGQEYLCAPIADHAARLLRINAARGFPGMLGSIDCQHWQWKNCPLAWAGQYKGKEKTPTVVLEGIADGEL